ncbi:MAG: hypothetical protein ACYS8I_04725 [Planctomycetota bacterium]|jgi:hypothetical protein
MLSPKKFNRVVTVIVTAAAVGAVYGPWVSVVVTSLPRLLSRRITLTSFFAGLTNSALWLYLVGAAFGAFVGWALTRRIKNIENRKQADIGATAGCAASGIGLIVVMCVSFVVAGIHTATTAGWTQCLITLLFTPMIFSLIALFVALPLGLLGGILVALILWPILRILRPLLPVSPQTANGQQDSVPDQPPEAS